MKSYYLSLLFILVFSSVFAQDTIYMDKFYSELDSQVNAEFYKVIKPVDGEKYDFINTTFFINGKKHFERSYYIKNGKKVLEGKYSWWYDSGEFFFSVNYKKGKMDGILEGFWPDGSKRRVDIFKNGKFKSGTVWNNKGEEIEHFDHHEPPKFPGGMEAFRKYLIENKRIPNTHHKRERVVVLFHLDKTGKPYNIKFVEKSNDPYYMAEVYRLISEMPAWEPGNILGEPRNGSFTLPVVFD